MFPSEIPNFCSTSGFWLLAIKNSPLFLHGCTVSFQHHVSSTSRPSRYTIEQNLTIISHSKGLVGKHPLPSCINSFDDPNQSNPKWIGARAMVSLGYKLVPQRWRIRLYLSDTWNQKFTRLNFCYCRSRFPLHKA